MRRPNWRTRRRQRAQELGRKRGLASARSMRQRRMEREPDAETVLRRAQHDARGQLVAEGHTYTAHAVTYWQVVRSRIGQYRQFDEIVDGVVCRTGGVRALASWLGISRRSVTRYVDTRSEPDTPSGPCPMAALSRSIGKPSNLPKPPARSPASIA